MKQLLKKIHLFLSKDLSEALSASSADNGYVKALFFVELTAINALFITEDTTAHLILIYILIPFIFIPLKFEVKSFANFGIPIPIKFSFYNIFRNTIICRRPLFLTVVVYGADKAFLSYLYPEPVFGYLHIFFFYLLAPLLAFMVATVRLAVDEPNFYYSLFRITTPFVALNAVANFYLFLKTIPALSSLGNYRLQSSFGAAMGYNPNLDALIHAAFLVGLIITVINNKSKYEWFISGLTIVILFFSILLEQSRGCSLAVIITIFLYVIIWKPIIRLRIIYASIAFFILIIVYIYAVLPDGLNTYFSRPNYLRPEIWSKFYHLIKDNSFIGLGDRFIFSIPLSNGEIAPHPHNIILSSLVRGGIIGLLSILFIIILGLLRTYQYALRSHNAVPFCVFLTVMIAGIFDFDLKVWQSGWYLAGYWLAIAFALGADAALKMKNV